MAKYTNRLDNFQSHSIHYVLLASRSTEELRPFTAGTESAESLLAIDSCKKLGGEVVLAGSSSNGVFLLMDTRRFSQFSISNFSIDTTMAGFSIPGSNSPNSVAQEMAFTVIDSAGISFANYLQYLMEQKLSVSYQGMVVLVKILFIGHNTDGSTQVVQSIGIPGIFKSIQVDLNEVRGSYDCKLISLVGVVSNPSNNSEWTTISDASNYFTGEGANTLGSVVSAFERKLNEVSAKRFSQYNSRIKSDQKKINASFGRPVQYMITLPKGWDEYVFSGPSQGSATEINFKALLQEESAKQSKTISEQQKKAQTNAVAPAKDSFVSANPNTTIVEVLDFIFKQTVKVQELGNFSKTKDSSKDIKLYKQLVSVSSSEDSFTVHIDVVEYLIPNVSTAKSSLAASDKLYFEEVLEDGRQPARVPRNFLEFDYIFSGKNLDVINLDLKIDNLNIWIMSKSEIGQSSLFVSSDNAQKQDDRSPMADQTENLGMRKKDPVLMPKRTAEEDSNFSSKAANVKNSDGETPQSISQEYTRNVASWYSANGIQAKMTIRGNPDYFERIVLSTIPEHVSASSLKDGGELSTENKSVKEQYRRTFEKDLLRISPNMTQTSSGGFVENRPLNGPSHVASSIFVKVNVFGPNVDFFDNELIDGQDFATKLFYDNYYWVSQVVSKIDGSKFTQEFTLYPFSIYSAPGRSTGTQQEKKV